MKTSIKTLIATSLTTIILTSAIFATSAIATEKRPETASVLATPFKKVVVKGNVEITLVQRQNEGVAYTDENIGKAKITQEGNVLRITSADKEVTRLVVYVNDIYRIEAGENAVVKTNGKIKSKYLQIFLSGNAQADINSATEGLYTVISGNSDLKLSGSTDNHTLIMGKTPKLTIDRFAALKTNISSFEAGATEIAALVK